MRITLFIFLLCIVVCSTGEADPINLEAFKKKSLKEQARDIAKAPPEQQAELVTIHEHSARLDSWGGEAGLRRVIESYVCQDRGVGSLETIFNIQLQLWEDYYSATDMAYRKVGEITDDAMNVLKKMDGERQALIRQRDSAHVLAFHMAASPEALKLAKKAEILEQELIDKYGLSGTPAPESINKTAMREVEKQIEEIYAKMKTLPTLPLEELRKEYDAVPEERVQPGK